MLDKTQESDLIRAAQRGDSAAAQVLLDQHQPLIRRIIRDTPWSRGIDRDDVEQEAALAAWTAIIDYDAGRGVRLSHLLRLRVMSALRANWERMHGPVAVSSGELARRWRRRQIGRAHV